ncbi:hypothetical protein GC197_10920 [bacterium]|nr:hypothetical protein [bacterium]
MNNIARLAFPTIVVTFLLAHAASAQIPNQEPYPQTTSKKGIQIQMVDDAISLGIQHATLNVNLTRLIDLKGNRRGPRWTVDGTEYAFSPALVKHLDDQVKRLSDQGIVVTLILLTYASGEPDRDQLMLHPDYAAGEKATGPIGMFNTTTAEGRQALEACIEFLAHRYSSDRGHGRVWGYICGNEVNSHWHWANMGHATPDQVVTQYERAVRLIHKAVRKCSANARVYISLEHWWNQRYPHGDSSQTLPGRELIDRFASQVKKLGDFDWDVAYHPYPAPLLKPRFWLDEKFSLHSFETPCITFRNLEVLTDYLQQKPMLFEGKPRRVILSEQGFHCDESRPNGEAEQAAAFALAYKKVESLPGIDAFILHRHVDHAHEGALKVGLWTRKPGSICEPDQKRKIYKVFKAAGTPEEDEAFAFALPIVGAKDWSEALQNLMHDQESKTGK